MGGRKNMIKFSHGMLKNFYGILNISSKTECLEHLAEENTDIMVLAGKYTNPSQSNAMIIFIATASFRLPLPSEYVFDFFRDPTKRAKVQKFNFFFFNISSLLVYLFVTFFI